MESAALTIAIAQAILRYGPTAVITISKAFDKGEPTVEDINQLFIDKSPVEYFK